MYSVQGRHQGRLGVCYDHPLKGDPLVSIGSDKLSAQAATSRNEVRSHDLERLYQTLYRVGHDNSTY